MPSHTRIAFRVLCFVFLVGGECVLSFLGSGKLGVLKNTSGFGNVTL